MRDRSEPLLSDLSVLKRRVESSKLLLSTRRNSSSPFSSRCLSFLPDSFPVLTFFLIEYVLVSYVLKLEEQNVESHCSCSKELNELH